MTCIRNSTLLVGALALVGAGCGPAQFPGREGFGETGPIDTGTESSGSELPDPTETETETGDPECPEAVNMGGVSIGDVEVLAALDGVTRIEGDVEITGSFGELPEGLDALRCLDEITGYLYVHDTDLVNFVGLEKLRRIGDYFYVGQTFNLESLEGLGALRQIGSYLHLNENFAMFSTIGTDLLVEVGDFVIVDGNPLLQDLLGFSSLPGTNGQLRIEANPSLTSLAGLENMIGLNGDLGIVNNTALTDASALSGLQAIGGNVLYQNNPIPALGLGSLQTIDGYLFVVDMPTLGTLDDLQGLIGINRHLYLWNTGVQNLDGLIDLQFLGGNVWIEQNSNLQNVDGLSSLGEVDGLLRIDLNPALVDASGLGNIVTVSDGLSLWGNPQLSSFSLASLQSVGDFLRIGFSSLTDIPPIPVTQIGGDLLVFNNDGLVNASGFFNLQTLGGDLYVLENPALENLALPALSQMFGRVLIIDNDALRHLNGLSALQATQGVIVRDNWFLNSVAGLSGLTQIPGNFRIVLNGGLHDLTGLDALTQVGGDVDIRDNGNLTAISGLNGLNVVSGDLIVTGNDDLPTCIAQGFVDSIASVGGTVSVSGNLADSCGG
jgi:hypothetical protein